MKLTWSTPFTRHFPCRLPIMGAPMLGTTCPDLAVETCRAGGLGFLAAGHLNTEEAYQTLEAEIHRFKQLKDSHLKASEHEEFPLCIGFIAHSTFGCQLGWKLFEMTLEKHRPSVVQFFAGSVLSETGDKSSMNAVEMAHKYGSKVIMQVGSVKDGLEAFELGVDCICAQGTEAGGHGLRRDLGSGTLSLTSKLVELSRKRDKPIPILAAGGIVDGRDLASVLALGADGAVLGTRLYASNESVAPKSFKEVLVAAESGDAVVRTMAFDTIWNSYRETLWPAPFDSSGTLRNQVTDEWDNDIPKLEEALSSGDKTAIVDPFKHASTAGDPTLACVYSGKGIGKITSIDPACDIILRIEMEAVDAIRRAQTLFGDTTRVN